MTVTPSDLQARAIDELDHLGPEPETPRECVQWRERRESATLKIAALADWNPTLLAQAAALAAAQGDDDVHALLRDACGWTPRGT